METTIYNQLHKATAGHVKNFIEDLTIHDKKQIEETRKGLNFIHIARECGTHIQFFNKPEDYPEPGEQVNYLFGKANREKILKDEYSTLKYRLEQEGIKIHFFDGKVLKRIKKETAINLLENHHRTITNRWEEAERPQLKTA